MCAVMQRFVLAVLSSMIVSGVVVAEEPQERPLFPEVTFTALDGQTTMTMSEFRGRPVLVTFWASWCGPCRVELPELSKLYGELAGTGFVLITVNVDLNPVAGRQFLERLGLRLPVYRLQPMETKRLGINALPTNILLDTEGRLVRAYKGYEPQVVEEVRQMVVDMTAATEP
jgi:thiol-disulfide isomerase/thioredoxin